jgi:hypothetical protein
MVSPKVHAEREGSLCCLQTADRFCEPVSEYRSCFGFFSKLHHINYPYGVLKLSTYLSEPSLGWLAVLDIAFLASLFVYLKMDGSRGSLLLPLYVVLELTELRYKGQRGN